MKKRTIALLLLTALLGILLTSCGEDERNHYSPGYWRDNVFYDAFVDLRFTLPDGWEATSQEDLDAMLSSGRSAAPVPKGLQLRTLARVRECLAQAPREGCTCEALSEQVGLSSVTVRRYLTYLVGRGEAVSRINYDTGGRPSLLYRLSQTEGT